METRTDPSAPSMDPGAPGTAPGAAMAAVLAAGIGSFAMGFSVLANELGLVPAPALYEPVGGLSGRTTFAVATWLVAWAFLHRTWADRGVDPGPVRTATIVLVVVALLATFPPLWSVLG